MHPISDRVFLGGALRAPRGDARITVLNPSTGEPLGEIPDGTAADVDDAVAVAMEAADAWAATPAQMRDRQRPQRREAEGAGRRLSHVSRHPRTPLRPAAVRTSASHAGKKEIHR